MFSFWNSDSRKSRKKNSYNRFCPKTVLWP